LPLIGAYPKEDDDKVKKQSCIAHLFDLQNIVFLASTDITIKHTPN
jgi:hypothetical protein